MLPPAASAHAEMSAFWRHPDIGRFYHPLYMALAVAFTASVNLHIDNIAGRSEGDEYHLVVYAGKRISFRCHISYLYALI